MVFHLPSTRRPCRFREAEVHGSADPSNVVSRRGQIASCQLGASNRKSPTSTHMHNS